MYTSDGSITISLKIWCRRVEDLSDLRINIHGRNDNNTITNKDYPKFEESANRLKSMGGSNASKNIKIVFEPSAVNLLFESIGWGRKYKRDDVEQAGILVGNYYRDSSDRIDLIWGDVIAVVPAASELVNASFEKIDITTAAWKKMYDDAAVYRTENLQILGWYHTHLDEVGTRFSSVDTITQRKAFTYEYSFGVVFNPNQEKWSAFYGPNSTECIGELIFDEALEVKYGKPKIMINQVSGDSVLQGDGRVVHLDENGEPIQNVEHRPPNNTIVPPQEFASIKEFIGQSIIKLGQRLSRPKNIPNSQHSTNRPTAQQPNTNNENQRNRPIVQQANVNRENPKNKPKIKINNINPMHLPIQYRYFSLSSNNELIEDVNLETKIKDNDTTKIINQKRKNNNSDDKLRRGRLIGEKSNMQLHIVGEKDQSANSKIIFTTNPDVILKTAIDNQQIPQMIFNKINYIIFINDEDTEEIEVRIIHFG